MTIMRQSTFYGLIILLFSNLTSCQGQTKTETLARNQTETNKLVGGGCDGCELMYVGMPKNIDSEDVSLGWNEKNNKKLILTGTVFKLDGKTPASDVIIYYWHTDKNGLYASDKSTPQKAKIHGRLRGWVKTDKNGKYTLKTSLPAPYPKDVIPQHIHLSIKEPDIQNEYFTDLYFDDDKLYLAHKKKYGKIDRCGTELLRVLLQGEIRVAEHNLILGLNIPNYPKTTQSKISSGLEIGEDNPSFTPYHAFGPDKGTRACPVCKYGRFHGIVYFVGNNPDWYDIKRWLTFLEQESISRSKYLKAYFVYGNEKDYDKNSRQKQLEKIGTELNLKNVALTFVPSMTDIESEVNLNKINPTVENTFVIYRHRTIIDKFINLKATADNYETISSTLNKTKGDYFNLSEPKHD